MSRCAPGLHIYIYVYIDKEREREREREREQGEDAGEYSMALRYLQGWPRAYASASVRVLCTSVCVCAYACVYECARFSVSVCVVWSIDMYTERGRERVQESRFFV